ncbi:MAG: ParB/RepB/Spo0J family partition protein [Verrucomicrobiota bacterium]
MSKPALGRGLGALLGGPARPAPPSPGPTAASIPAAPVAPATAPGGPGSLAASPTPPSPGILRVSLAEIVPSPLQPRKVFTAESLGELAASITSQGILQPLVVRRVADRYELIAGERRWRAAQQAGLDRLPVLVREATDLEVLELALVENLQRENLNPLEEAVGYQQLQERFQLTQEQVAAKVGRSRVAVANALRLLRLPEGVQAAVREGRLSVGHAKAVLALADPGAQAELARRILHEGLNVRQAEKLAAQLAARPGKPAPPGPPPPANPSPADPHVAALENQLRERFATRVKVHYRRGAGSVEIQFDSDDQLNRVLGLLGIAVD